MMTRLDSFFEKLKGKHVLVLGVGVSNRPLVRLLLKYGIDVTCCDKTSREKLDQEVLELEAQGAKLHLGEGYLDGIAGDVVFRTPGLHPDTPQIKALRESGAVITSEMEAFFAVCPAQIIAVTGSDGKTTTSTLISELLKKQGYRVWLGGNIGTPLLVKADDMEPTDQVVLELSSFQLMYFPYSPHTAVITNLSPNHLDIHRDMEEYVTAKENLYLHQKPGDLLILNRDNSFTHSFAPKARGQVEEFSRLTEPERGVFLRDGVIWRKGENTEKVLDQSDILLPGIHNVENYMAAILAVGDRVSTENIRAVARSFGGVEHRIELVREKDGVRYYNDSIASSPTRTIAGLRSFNQKLILIAGGYDKHVPFEPLGPEIVDHVKLLILTGATAPKIEAAVLAAPNYVPGSPEILHEEDFYEAIRLASRKAKPGDSVILSPAGPAFDKFKNFMVRGKEFKRTVMEL
ncbi:MAG: UDP-N-acetylmuramoyl-L-alanine--D-glutamate ligase [Oscillospiraceae bacterium]|nr:UDP-N-acetylmuramoyl-L-alanine--D-glutamate ligase [Oscillospiraceae bacterium]